MQESYRDLKYIYTDILNNLKSPEKTGGILILLTLYKFFSASKFVESINIFIDKFEFVIDLLETLFVSSLIACSISVLLIIIFGVLYIFMRKVYINIIIKECSDKHIEWVDVLRRYFIGSQFFAVKAGMWVSIFCGYLNLLDTERVKVYINLLNIKNNNLCTFLDILIIIVIFNCFISVITIIKNILREFFYLKHIKIKTNDDI